MTDAEIDFSDNPELTSEMFENARVRCGLKSEPGKVQLSLQMDRDVLAWF